MSRIAMAAGRGDDKQSIGEAALQRQAERSAQKDARLAEALRQNLKRRKEQSRRRSEPLQAPQGVGDNEQVPRD